MTVMLDAALTCALRNWRAHPLYSIVDGQCDCHRPSECKPGKHPRLREWQHKASASGADIAEWWQIWPAANLGILTDPAFGWVLDIDPDSGGDTTLAQLVAQHGPFLATRTHRTGSGGTHYVWKWPDFDVPRLIGKSGLGAGIDVLGTGSFIVAPPSVSGKGAYTVTDDREPVPAPEWLLQLIRGHVSQKTAAATGQLFAQPDTGRKHTGSIPMGNRHAELVSYAGWLRRRDYPLRPEAETLMLRRLKDCEQPPAAPYPVTEAEAIAKLHDVYGRYTAGDPAADNAALNTTTAAAALPVGQVPGVDQLAAAAAKYQPVNWAQAWDAQPGAVDWLVPDFLEAATTNALFAPPGTGKSLLAQEIAADLARRGITVVYIDDENRVADYVERLRDMGRTPAELGQLLLYSFAGLPPLDTPAGGAELEAIAAAAAARLVILDTTSRMVQGRENDADTFIQLYRCSLVPLKARGITVLRLDHPGKDMAKGQRGSSAKDGDVDTVWSLEEITKGTRYQLSRRKSRSGHGEPAITLRRHAGPLRHEWVTGAPASSWIIAKLDELGVSRDAGRDKARAVLSRAGFQASNTDLAAALRARKLGSEPVRGPVRASDAEEHPNGAQDLPETVLSTPQNPSSDLSRTGDGQVGQDAARALRLTCPPLSLPIGRTADRSGAPDPDSFSQPIAPYRSCPSCSDRTRDGEPHTCWSAPGKRQPDQDQKQSPDTGDPLFVPPVFAFQQPYQVPIAGEAS